jgi:hypothetical protein
MRSHHRRGGRLLAAAPRLIIPLAFVAGALAAAGPAAAGPAAATDPNTPIGSISILSNAQARTVRVAGWSLDRNAPAASVTLSVTVNGHALQVLATDRVFAGVNKALHATGRHGIDRTWKLGIGRFKVCVVAHNIGAGRINPTLACASVAFASLPLNDQIAAYARTFVGKAHYVEGARGPSNFDCSGLTQYVYGHVGKAIKNTADPQYHQFRAIPRAAARPGDLIFFHQGNGYVWHVGIYQGGDKMVAAADEHYGIRLQTWTWWPNVSFGTITH